LLVKYWEASFAQAVTTAERNPVKRLKHVDPIHTKTIVYQTRLRRWSVENLEYDFFSSLLGLLVLETGTGVWKVIQTCLILV
jgi:hypothetical protein